MLVDGRTWKTQVVQPSLVVKSRDYRNPLCRSKSMDAKGNGQESDGEHQNVLQWSKSKETDECGQDIEEDRDKMNGRGPLVEITNEVAERV